MKIIIAGAGAVGTHLAKLLSGEKQDIILMDDSQCIPDFHFRSEECRCSGSRSFYRSHAGRKP